MSFENELRTKVKEALEQVTKANSPNIFDFIHNKNGQLCPQNYIRMENRIINKLVKNPSLNIWGVIPQIEQEMSGL